MSLDKLKFGFELAMIGALSLLSPAFLFMAQLKINLDSILRIAVALHNSGLLPYLLLSFVAISYLSGLIMDALTHMIVRIFMRKRLHSPDQINVAQFFNKASSELIHEYNFKRGQNLILRVSGISLLINAFSISYWLCRLEISAGFFIIPGILFVIGILVLIAFFELYQGYEKFRNAAFTLFHQ